MWIFPTEITGLLKWFLQKASKLQQFSSAQRNKNPWKLACNLKIIPCKRKTSWKPLFFFGSMFHLVYSMALKLNCPVSTGRFWNGPAAHTISGCFNSHQFTNFQLRIARQNCNDFTDHSNWTSFSKSFHRGTVIELCRVPSQHTLNLFYLISWMARKINSMSSTSLFFSRTSIYTWDITYTSWNINRSPLKIYQFPTSQKETLEDSSFNFWGATVDGRNPCTTKASVNNGIFPVSNWFAGFLPSTVINGVIIPKSRMK